MNGEGFPGIRKAKTGYGIHINALFGNQFNRHGVEFSVEITDLAVIDNTEYTIEVSGESFIATSVGNIIELDLDSQCNDGPDDNNCWLGAVELSDIVTVTGPGFSTIATLA